jgi:hypothetical protein
MLAPTANDAGSLPIWWGRQGQCNAGAQMSQAGGPQTHNHWLLSRIRGTQFVTRGRHQNRIKIVSPVIFKDLRQRPVSQLGVDLGQSDKQIGDEVGVDRIAIWRALRQPPRYPASMRPASLPHPAGPAPAATTARPNNVPADRHRPQTAWRNCRSRSFPPWSPLHLLETAAVQL